MIRARFYDGRTSGARQVDLQITGSAGAACLVIRSSEANTAVPLTNVSIGGRVGDTHRLLELADGGSLEVLDNEDFDRSLQAAGSRAAETSIRRFEGRWQFAALALVVLVAGSAGFLRYGAPALSARAIRFIPTSVDTAIGVDGLRILDEATLKPTALTAARQAQLQRLFAEVAAGASADAGRYHLELRKGGAIGANAFALPSGIVVLTDELDHLVKNDDELRGVFAHEVGHLVKRHAMRLLLQSSATALLLAGIFGDVSGASTLVTTVPTVLVHASYSRDFEREADEFAFRWMSQHDVDPARLGDLLSRLVETRGGGEEAGFLASHPSLRERVKAAQAHEAASPKRP